MFWNRRDTEALGLDSLIIDVNWTRWQLPYVSAFLLIPLLLRKIREQEVKKVMIALFKPNDPFLRMKIRLIKISYSMRLIMDLSTGEEKFYYNGCQPASYISNFWRIRDIGDLPKEVKALIGAG